MASYATVSTPGLQLIFEITDFSYNNDTIGDAILTRNQKLTKVNLIYRTEPTNCRIDRRKPLCPNQLDPNSCFDKSSIYYGQTMGLSIYRSMGQTDRETGP